MAIITLSKSSKDRGVPLVECSHYLVYWNLKFGPPLRPTRNRPVYWVVGWVVGWLGWWLAGSNENIIISTQDKVVVEVGVELGNSNILTSHSISDRPALYNRYPT